MTWETPCSGCALQPARRSSCRRADASPATLRLDRISSRPSCRLAAALAAALRERRRRRDAAARKAPHAPPRPFSMASRGCTAHLRRLAAPVSPHTTSAWLRASVASTRRGCRRRQPRSSHASRPPWARSTSAARPTPPVAARLFFCASLIGVEAGSVSSVGAVDAIGSGGGRTKSLLGCLATAGGCGGSGRRRARQVGPLGRSA